MQSSPGSLTVVPAEGEGLETFLSLPARIRRDDPGWVGSLSEAGELSSEGAFSRHADRHLLMCEQGGEVVGRIAAILNPRVRDASDAVVGQLGYFEAIDDEKVAAALIEAAIAWLAPRGAREVWGPLNGGSHRSHRLMTDGFQSAPFLFEPRTPPYYVRHFEQSGFRPFYTWQSYEFDADAVATLRQKLARMVARGLRQGFCIEQPEMVDPAAILNRLYRIVNATWSGHTAFGTIDPDEFTEAFAPLLPLITGRYVAFCVHEGRDVGMAFMYPDYIDEVRALNGDATSWGSWVTRSSVTAANGQGTVLTPSLPETRRLVLHSVAVLPEYRRTAAPAMLTQCGLDHVEEAGYEKTIVALVNETWKTFAKVAAPPRAYALYRRTIA
jgi:GNAT superfamily N-acetyltransferase